MIYTVFCAAADEARPWQSDLLEYSWGRVRQPGELVRLAPAAAGEPPPRQRLARVVATARWSPHPYTGDAYPPYDVAASLLEWLFGERIDGTVLLVPADCVFRTAVTAEAAAGRATATAWSPFPHAGDGPFHLAERLTFLERFCVDRTLEPPRVTLPVLIQARDLRRIAARWLELMSIVREETAPSGRLDDADAVAYAIAAAEAGVAHAGGALCADAGASEGVSPLLRYERDIASPRGETVWEKRSYEPWATVEPERVAPGSGRDFLAVLGEYAERRAAGGELAFVRPRRRPGVRVGRVLDRTLLEIPGRSDAFSLNPSAAAVWELCDGARSLADVGSELERRFQMPPGALAGDIQSVIDRLESAGAIDLEPA